jgi:hypothetical protein
MRSTADLQAQRPRQDLGSMRDLPGQLLPATRLRVVLRPIARRCAAGTWIQLMHSCSAVLLGKLECRRPGPPFENGISVDHGKLTLWWKSWWQLLCVCAAVY